MSQIEASTYTLGQTVYLKIAMERIPGMVTSVTENIDGSVIYGVTWGTGNEGRYYAAELAEEYVPDLGD
jgi:hypothetical protein